MVADKSSVSFDGVFQPLQDATPSLDITPPPDTGDETGAEGSVDFSNMFDAQEVGPPPPTVTFGPLSDELPQPLPGAIGPILEDVLAGSISEKVRMGKLGPPIDPQREARVRNMSVRFGIPQEVLRNTDPIELDILSETAQIEDASASSPVLQRYLNADISHLIQLGDSTEHLAETEAEITRMGAVTTADRYAARIGSGLSTMVGGVAQMYVNDVLRRAENLAQSPSDVLFDTQGADTLIPSITGVLSVVERSIGQLLGQDATEMQAYATELQERITELAEDVRKLPGLPGMQRLVENMQVPAGTPVMEELISGIRTLVTNPMDTISFLIGTGLEQIPRLSMAAGTTALTGNPAAGMSVMLASTIPTEGFGKMSEYLLKTHKLDLRTEEGRARFVNNPEIRMDASRYAYTRGIVIGGFEVLGTSIIGRRLSRNALGELTAQIGVQGLTGGMGELAGEYVSSGRYSVTEALLEAVGEFSTVGGDVIIAGRKMMGQRASRIANEQWRGTLERVHNTLLNTPANTRDAEIVAEVVGEQIVDAEIDAVYIDAEGLEGFQQAQITGGPSISELLGIDPDKLSRAVEAGGVVEVSPKDFVHHILGKPGFEALLDHISANPDRLTPLQARLAEETITGDALDLLNRERERLRAAVGVDDATLAKLDEDVEYIAEQVKTSDLTDMSQFSPQMVDTFSRYVAQRYVTRSIRAQQALSPREFWDRDNLQIQAEPTDIEGFRAEDVTSPEFQQFFGNSHVVDGSGAPLEVAHGTAAEFTEFNTNAPVTPSGNDVDGIFFSGEDHTAAGHASRSRRAGRGDRSRLIKAYLSIQSPLDITDRIAELQAEGMTFPQAKREALSALDREVHDGIIFRGDQNNSAEYVVFDSRQVKSVNNRGTFDPNDPNILNQSSQEYIDRAGRLLDTIKDNPNGFTVDPETGEAAAPGVVVAPLKQLELSFDSQKIGGDDVLEFLDHIERLQEVSDADVYAGGWLDEASGRYFLDAVYVMADKSQALATAVAGSQLAVFDLNDFTETRTETYEEIRDLKAAGLFTDQQVDDARREARRLGEGIARGRVRDRAGIDEAANPIGFNQSAAPYQSDFLEVIATGPHGRILNWDIGEAFDAAHLEAHGRILDPTNAEDYAAVLDTMSDEYAEQLGQHDTGEGWYVEDINQAIATTIEIIPELADPVHRDLFLTFAALLSPQERPTQNWEKAVEAYQGYLADGTIPLRKINGKKWGTNQSGTELLNYMLQTKTPAEVLEFLQTPHTGLQLAEMRRSSGVYREGDQTVPASKFLANETNQKSQYLGIYMFGPKVGDFMMNATGIDQTAVTVDIWMARTYNRNLGRLTDVSDTARDEKTIIGDIRGVGERRMIKRLVTDLAARHNIDPSAMQAALWYFEQRLFRNHGVQSSSTNFSGAAVTAAEKRGVVIDRAGEAVQGAGEAAADSVSDFEQGIGGAVRGQFIPSDMIRSKDGKPINLLEIMQIGQMDTLLHETGHFWLEQLTSDATEFGGELKTDLDKVTTWWGENSERIRQEAIRHAEEKGFKDRADEIRAMTPAHIKTFARSGNLRGVGAEWHLSVAMHEQWARGVETYFATGKAPSLTLLNIMQRFVSWLSRVYRQFRMGTDITFSDEVKGVMDRLIATDAEIEIMQSQYQLAGMYNSAAQAGMSKSEYDAYTKKVSDLAADKKSRLLRQKLKQADALKSDEVQEFREAEEARILSALQEKPIHNLHSLVAQGKLADGSDSATPATRLDRDDLIAFLKDNTALTITDLAKIKGRAVYTTKKGEPGLGVGEAVSMLGFDNADQMVNQLVEHQSLEQELAVGVEAAVSAAYTDSNQEAADRAESVIHEGSTAFDFISSELVGLRTVEAAFDPRFIKTLALQEMETARVGSVRPQTYRSAEQRHGEAAGRAARKGDKPTAYREKLRQLINHQMAKEADKVRKRIDQRHDRMSRYTNPRRKFPAIAADYVDKIKQIASSVNLGAEPADRSILQAEMRALAAWAQERQENDQAIMSIPSALQAMYDRRDLPQWRDMTVAAFDTLYDTVRMIEKQGALKKKLLYKQTQRDAGVVRAELLARIAHLPMSVSQRWRNQSRDENKKSRLWAKLAGKEASLVKMEFLVERLDGGKEGPWRDALFTPAADAVANEQKLRGEVIQEIMEVYNKIDPAIRKNLGKAVDVGLLDQSGMVWNRGNLIMMALNVGSESNMDKMIRGEQKSNPAFNEDNMWAALDQLTKEEWALVSEVGRVSKERLLPAMNAIVRAENGRGIIEVDTRPVETKFGPIPGWYWPMIYDHTMIGASSSLRNMDALQTMQAQQITRSVDMGMTLERNQSFAAPVELQASYMLTGLDKTIHTITHYDAIRNIKRILNNPELRVDVTNKLGRAYMHMMDDWAGTVAAGRLNSVSPKNFEQFIDGLAGHATLSILGYSYTTIGLQPLGVLIAYDRFLKDTTYGPVDMAKAMADIVTGVGKSLNPDTQAWVKEVSIVMDNRLGSFEREARALQERLRNRTDLKSRIAMMGVQVIGSVQYYAVDVPIFIASYNRALQENPGDMDGAVRYAERVVRMSQSANDVTDVSSAQQTTGLRPFLLFWSYGAMIYNNLRETGSTYRDTVGTEPFKATGRAAASAAITLTLVRVLEGVLRREEIPDLEPEDEDKQGLVKWMALQTLGSGLSTIPFVRDVSSSMLNGYGYRMSPISSLGFEMTSNATKVIKMMSEEDAEIVWDERMFKPMVTMLGLMTGLPSTQPNRMLDAWFAAERGEDIGPLDYLTGPKKAKE